MYVLYFYLQKKLESILSEKPEENQNGTTPAFDREAYLRDVEQVDDTEVVVAGRPPPTSVQDRKHERAEKLFLHYLQRWAKDYLRRRLDWVVEGQYKKYYYLYILFSICHRILFFPFKMKICTVVVIMLPIPVLAIYDLLYVLVR